MFDYIRHQISNLTHLHAVSWPAFLKRAVTLPMDFYLRKSGRSCPPIIITIDFLRCQMRCKMCYLGGLLNKNEKELTTQEWKDFIDSVAHFGATIFLAGGDSFTRPDIIEIIEHIHSKKLRWGITTNGIDARLPDVAKYSPAFVDVSIDGIGEVHDKIRGVPGAFERTVKNLRELCAKKTKRTRVFINFTLTENVGEIEKMIILTKEIGCDGIKIHHLSYHPKNEIELQKKATPNLELAYHEASGVKMDIDIKKIRAVGKKHGVPIIFRPELSQDEIPKWYNNDFGLPIKCYYSYLSPRVQSDGRILGCQFLRYECGNIRDEPLEKIWNNEKYRKIRRLKQLGATQFLCRRCCKA